MLISVDILDKFWPDTPLEFAAMGYYGMALHKTVPENRNTVTRLDREEDEISTTLGRFANEKNYAKELNRLSLQQKDTEIGTLALLDGPQSTLKNETLSDLVDETNQANNLSEKVDKRSVNFEIVIGTLTSSNDTKVDLTICLNEHQTGGSLLKKDHNGVCMKEREKLSLRINDLPSPTSPHQDILFLYEVQLRRNPGVGG